MKKLILGAALLTTLGLSTVAGADDCYPPYYPPQPPPPPVCYTTRVIQVPVTEAYTYVANTFLGYDACGRTVYGPATFTGYRTIYVDKVITVRY